MLTITSFEPNARYIFLPIFVITEDGKRREFDAILDTGAPQSEFSDEALHFAGFSPEPKKDIPIKQGLQTQKYSSIILPKVLLCSHLISNLNVYISHFEKSWGIDALIGLDFFRRFRVTIDYQEGQIITEDY